MAVRIDTMAEIGHKQKWISVFESCKRYAHYHSSGPVCMIGSVLIYYIPTYQKIRKLENISQWVSFSTSTKIITLNSFKLTTSLLIPMKPFYMIEILNEIFRYAIKPVFWY